MDNETSNKPKLIMFQFRYEEKVPQFLLIHREEHIKCLSQFFDVTVINHDCDYRQICEMYQPDLALFESGLEIIHTHRLQIKNTSSYSGIPKVAFFNADGCSERRTGSIADMEDWGIETAFSISICAAEHLPQINKNIFVWPNFIDPKIFKDYQKEKLIPALLTGSKSPRYPWRHKVYRVIEKNFPSLVCPHAGYVGITEKGRMLVGESYAKAINASLITPTCGSVTNEVVRKHFEIPGCRSCLVTERSPGLEAAGFIDMVNCVFVDENNVLEKLAYLFNNQEVLSEITDNGWKLVYSTHTIKNRNQLYQWFQLKKNLKNYQKIVQPNPFANLKIVSEIIANCSYHVSCNGKHLYFVKQGYKYLLNGKYEESEKCFLRCLNLLSEFPEAKLGLTLCNLYMGNPKESLSWIVQPLQCTLAGYDSVAPDPIEWAYFIIVLISLGKLKQARKRSKQFSWLRHEELDRARWTARFLSESDTLETTFDRDVKSHHYSIHRLTQKSLISWISDISKILVKCGQVDYSKKLNNCIAELRKIQQDNYNYVSINEKILNDREKKMYGKKLIQMGIKPTLRKFDNPELMQRFKKKISGILIKLSNRLEKR